MKTSNITVFKNDIPDDFKCVGDIAIDTEAMGLSYKRDRLCTVQFCDDSGKSYIVHFVGNDYSAPNLKTLLSDEKRTKIFHFARFDIGIIEYYLGIKIENIFFLKLLFKIIPK